MTQPETTKFKLVQVVESCVAKSNVSKPLPKGHSQKEKDETASPRSVGIAVSAMIGMTVADSENQVNVQ